jgi:cysteinyl-tRNA synthetase
MKITFIEKYSQLLSKIIEDPSPILLYCCGPTTKKQLHMGNYRSVLFLDLISKLRERKGYPTITSMNYTDLDDNIIEKIGGVTTNVSRNIDYRLLQKRVKGQFLKKLSLLGINYKKWKFKSVIRNLRSLETLSKSKKLSKVTSQREGGLFFENKETSFYLWKKNNLINKLRKKVVKGQPSWHLECAGFINSILQKNKEIEKVVHLGGIDLKDLHHKNEMCILKTIEPTNLKQVVFCHSHLVNIEGTKISKSKNNQIYLDKDPLYNLFNFFLSDFFKSMPLNNNRHNQVLSLIKKFKGTEEKQVSLFQNPASLIKESIPGFKYFLKKLYFSL